MSLATSSIDTKIDIHIDRTNSLLKMIDGKDFMYYGTELTTEEPDFISQ